MRNNVHIVACLSAVTAAFRLPSLFFCLCMRQIGVTARRQMEDGETLVVLTRNGDGMLGISCKPTQDLDSLIITEVSESHTNATLCNVGDRIIGVITGGEFHTKTREVGIVKSILKLTKAEPLALLLIELGDKSYDEVRVLVRRREGTLSNGVLESE
jgi:hypothetical protein